MKNFVSHPAAFHTAFPALEFTREEEGLATGIIAPRK
jgi:hypothetical protein